MNAKKTQRGFVALLLAITSACAAAPAARVRYANRDPIWQVMDQRLIRQPEVREFSVVDKVQTMYMVPVFDGLGFPGFETAHNINAIGEVPNSSWWTNRIGVRDVTPEELAIGPGAGMPAPEPPFTIKRTKVGGMGIGFIVEDAAGNAHIMKFDDPLFPEGESAADIILARLLWGVGYFTPDDQIIHFRRDQLIIDEGAVRENQFGDEVPLDDEHLDQTLALVNRPDENGVYRGFTSRFLDGVVIGGYPMQGRRGDDPNDRIDHEHRRDVRAQGVFLAWLDQADIKEDNTLDMWVPVRDEAELGYVRHHLVDFGRGLGTFGAHDKRPWIGWAPQFDWGYFAGSLVTFGLWQRPWDGVRASRLPAIGRYSVDAYEPQLWAPNRLWFPLRRMDRLDAFWASKIIMRYDREHIEAVVAVAELSDPRSSEYLVEQILARQRKTARHWFQGTAPFDGFRIEATEAGDHRVCATDLWRYYGFDELPVSYRFTAYDHAGEALSWESEPRADDAGRLCADGLPHGLTHEDYTIVRMDLTRGDDELPATLVHFARNDEDELRLIGVHRL